MRDVRKTGGWRGVREGPGKRVDGMFSGRPQSFRYQGRPVDDCSCLPTPFCLSVA